MVVTEEELFAKENSYQYFDDLVKKAILNNKSILLKIENNKIEIDLEEYENKTIIFGKLKIENIDNMSGNIFFPFITNIFKINISTKNFYYYPNGYRSIADFFMRNLATIYLTKQNVFFEQVKNKNQDNSMLEMKLLKILFWDYKKYFSNFVTVKKTNLDFNKLYFSSYFPAIDYGIDIINSYQRELNTEILKVVEENRCKILTKQFLNEREQLKTVKLG